MQFYKSFLRKETLKSHDDCRRAVSSKHFCQRLTCVENILNCSCISLSSSMVQINTHKGLNADHHTAVSITCDSWYNTEEVLYASDSLV